MSSKINNEFRLLIKNELQYLKFKRPKYTSNTKTIYKKYQEIIDISTFFLNEDIHFSERLYCYINNISSIPKCLHCKTNNTKFQTFKYGYYLFCSKKCATKSDYRNINIQQTNLKRYGVKNVMQNKEIFEKSILTNLIKYGVENPQQNKDIKNKTINTSFKKYGVKYYTQSNDFQNKKTKTMMDKYGVEHALQNKDIQNKKTSTILNRFGVKHALQNETLFEKAKINKFKRKEYILPSGKVIVVQGYENYAIDILLEQNYEEKQIITNSKYIPNIQYYTIDGIKHRYYCDIYIPHENRLIEVKSEYTFDKDKEINLLKQKASRDSGYDYEIWIIDNKGSMIYII